MAGNVNNIQEIRNIHVGFFWLWVIAAVSAVLIAAIVAAVIHNIRKRRIEEEEKRAGGRLICKIGTFYLLFQNRNNIIMPGKGRKVSWHYYKATTDCKHWDDNFELIKWQL